MVTLLTLAGPPARPSQPRKLQRQHRHHAGG
jgi:hypothetical protein